MGTLSWIVTTTLVGILLKTTGWLNISPLLLGTGLFLLAFVALGGVKAKIKKVKIPWNYLKKDYRFRGNANSIHVLFKKNRRHDWKQDDGYPRNRGPHSQIHTSGSAGAVRATYMNIFSIFSQNLSMALGGLFSAFIIKILSSTWMFFINSGIVIFAVVYFILFVREDQHGS